MLAISYTRPKLVNRSFTVNEKIPLQVMEEVLNSRRVAVSVTGKEFVKAHQIVTNGCVALSETVFTEMKYSGEEAVKIVINWNLE